MTTVRSTERVLLVSKIAAGDYLTIDDVIAFAEECLLEGLPRATRLAMGQNPTNGNWQVLEGRAVVEMVSGYPDYVEDHPPERPGSHTWTFYNGEGDPEPGHPPTLDIDDEGEVVPHEPDEDLFKGVPASPPPPKETP
jgi:hypothetical protein